MTSSTAHCMNNMSETIKGIVFDVQRSSLHDGPGIRTSVFLKGCPLRCIWCHNPESQSGKPELYYMAMRCMLCGGCVAACPYGCHKIEAEVHTIDRTRCTVCGKCAQACMAGALEIKGREMTVDDVMADVSADRAYYARSGGGITVTGGEPMAQFGFTLALFERCAAEGIHTCMETCGFAPTENFRRIMELTNLFLFDYKATGGAHKELTGVDHALILKNLDMILCEGGSVILRCPMVPGINDTDEHLRAIAGLEDRYPTIQGIEIMAYHNMGVSKAARVGRQACLEELNNSSEEQKALWLEKLRSFGAKKATIG